jgi:hypothetical protein
MVTMDTLLRRHRESVIRTPEVPTLAQMVRDGQASTARIKRASVEALHEWFAQSDRLNIARSHYQLRGDRFVDFARRIGLDRSSAFQLIKLWKHKRRFCPDARRRTGFQVGRPASIGLSVRRVAGHHRRLADGILTNEGLRRVYLTGSAAVARLMLLRRRRPPSAAGSSPSGKTDSRSRGMASFGSIRRIAIRRPGARKRLSMPDVAGR